MLRILFVAASATVAVWLLFSTTVLSGKNASHWVYTSSATQHEDHGELIAVLTELLVLLEALVAIEPGSVLYPLPETGLHPPGMINDTAASAAGYSAQAISLMYSLPYLYDFDFQLGHDTHLVSYTWPDEEDFLEQRMMLYDEGNLMPSSAVQVTRGESIYGLYRIYDTEKKVVYPWDYNDSNITNENYFHVPPLSPREAFQPLIDDFRSLNWLLTGEPFGLETEWPWAEFPRDWGESFRKGYEASYDVWKAKRGLKDVYLDCGWDIETLDQTSFRREYFIERRQRYLQDVVAPLEEVDRRVSNERREQEAAANELYMSEFGYSPNMALRVFEL